MNITKSFYEAMEDIFWPSLTVSGVYPWMECLGFSNSNAKTWDEGAGMWIEETCPLRYRSNMERRTSRLQSQFPVLCAGK